MTGNTKIEWADKVWNPVVGCTPGSEGCRNCYAKRIYERFHHGSDFSNLHFIRERLQDPGKWKTPSKIFVNSMSDLFHPNVSDAMIETIWQVMFLNHQHTFMVLTKRPERMKDRVNKMIAGCMGRVFSNIWLGVSIEDQKTADERIPLLLKTPAAKRFVSVEPMLGGVYLETYLKIPPLHVDIKGKSTWSGLDWVICGGESGPGARPMHPVWVRSLRDQCLEAQVPFFFKQWGEWTTQPGSVDLSNRKQTFFDNYIFARVGKKSAGNLLDGKVWAQFPELSNDRASNPICDH